MSRILDTLNNELKEIFKQLGYDDKFAFFQYSDRPDLSDFQTNASLALCKILGKPPLTIANSIVDKLKQNDSFSSITVDGPGFINVKISEKLLAGNLNNSKLENLFNKPKLKVIIDFGGPNVAKEMHVGHLRSTVIGESIRRIYKFCGDDIISDVHQGDWGTNMGMVIESIKLMYPDLECFKDGFNDDKIIGLDINATKLTEIYRAGSAKAKEDETFAEKCRQATKLLQDGYKPYRVLWQHFVKISLDDIAEIFDIFGAHFDLWNGESHVHNIALDLIKEYEEKGLIVNSDGAKIISLEEDNLPPVIVEKSDGALMYASSDLGTIKDRRVEYNPDLILYVVDSRQDLHFKQVFAVCKKMGLLEENHRAEFCPFGTMNGKDGKPFKTRSGDIIRLRVLIEEVVEKIKEKLQDKNDDVSAKKIAVACIKFADLINFRESNYIFDMDSFTSYEGKTGAYVLYGLVRINSILNACPEKNYSVTTIRTKEERDLALELTRFGIVLENAYNKKAPNFIADYVYTLTKKFSSFYGNCRILNETDEEYKNSKLALLKLTKQWLLCCLDLLGIEPVDKM